MSQNSPIHGLHPLGQSVWLDYISRKVLDNGELKAMIATYDLRGVTSNPSIFEEAIARSSDYDSALEALAADGLDAGKAYEALAVEDIRAACDLFRPVFDAAGGHDGFVSLEVSPEIADDADAALAEARHLWQAVDRPNLMVKIPGTAGGSPAIEDVIADGINVNVTLLFSLEDYERVMEAYLRGLERRVEAGQPIEGIASVASFFLSRVDSSVDGQLEKIGTPEAKALLGKAAVANARVAYARFQEIFAGERWEKLAARGARVQRPLWASTGTKNAAYSDVLYVEELVGPHTVNTMPLGTVKAFADHGVPRRSIDQGVDEARATLEQLAAVGIDMDAVTRDLQADGVDKFVKAFRGMIRVVGEKMAGVAAGNAG